jgi:hypothetical protein
VCRLPHPHPTPWPIPLLADQVVRGHAGSAYAVLFISSGAHVPWPFFLAHCTVSSPVAPLAFGTSEAVVGVCVCMEGCVCGWGEGWVHEYRYSVQTRCTRPFEHTLFSRAPLPRHPFSQPQPARSPTRLALTPMRPSACTPRPSSPTPTPSPDGPPLPPERVYSWDARVCIALRRRRASVCACVCLWHVLETQYFSDDDPPLLPRHSSPHLHQMRCRSSSPTPEPGPPSSTRCR